MDKLHISQHISRQFNEELEEVRSKVLFMGGIVEEQLANAVKALVSGKAGLAREVIESDKRVNSLELEIDEECTRIVARRQPAATDLRLVMTVIKTINDLERIGDEAKRVAKMSLEELDGVLSEHVREEFSHMGELVRDMLRKVLDAFARTDVNAAVEVVKADKKVDRRYKGIIKQLIEHMSTDPDAVPTVINILWAARSIERMGDRCQNVAEYVIYLALGMDVRHTSLDDVLAEIEAQSVTD